MDKEKIYEFYDYLLRKIGAESRDMLYDYIYDSSQIEFAEKFFPDDDERHYQFQFFFESHIERLDKEGLIVIKYKNAKPREVGLSELGERICTHGGYLQYQNDKELAQKRKEENRQRIEDESNERKWNICNNIVQTILGIITSLSIIGGWVFEKSDNTLFSILLFISGCLLGYGVNNRIKKHYYTKHVHSLQTITESFQ